MSGVFISYRRDDSRGSAGRLYDTLTDRFGTGRVFRDLDAIQPGAVYEDVIAAAIARCDVLLVVIGDSWIDARDAAGQRRIDNPRDLVRIEIGTALAQGKLVIPVLVEDAEMPSEADLPAELSGLAHRNAVPVSDHRWDHDVGRLALPLEGLLGPTAARPDPVPQAARPGRLPSWAIPALVAVVLGSAGLGAALAARGDGGDGPPVTTIAVASTAPRDRLRSGAASAGCVNGWAEPAPGTDQRRAPLDVLRRMQGRGGLFEVRDLRAFRGPDDAGGAASPAPEVERWYGKVVAADDPAFRLRFLAKRGASGPVVVAVAPFDSAGFRSGDWVGVSGDGPPVEHPGISGRWPAPPPADAASGALPAGLVGCLVDS